MNSQTTSLRRWAALALAVASALSSVPALSQGSDFVKVEGAWARATVPGQRGTGAFMTLTAAEPLSLVGVASPVAGVAEVHEMKMEGDVMKMRAIAGIDLPAGKPVQLKPGSYHLMLMELKAPLKVDTRIPVTLQLRDAKGKTRELQVAVPVAAMAPPAAGGHKH